MRIKNWFMEQEFTRDERYAISVTDQYEVLKESEKAIQVRWNTEFGKITRWIPKSVIIEDIAPAETEATHRIEIAKWLANKYFLPEKAICRITRETEKAVLVDFGSLEVWMPKKSVKLEVIKQ